jgi:hypothetical protein
MLCDLGFRVQDLELTWSGAPPCRANGSMLCDLGFRVQDLGLTWSGAPPCRANGSTKKASSIDSISSGRVPVGTPSAPGASSAWSKDLGFRAWISDLGFGFRAWIPDLGFGFRALIPDLGFGFRALIPDSGFRALIPTRAVMGIRAWGSAFRVSRFGV